MYKDNKRYFWLLLGLLIAFFTLNIYADGSRNLYPSGIEGRRAFLRSSTNATENWPFANEGTHYVYAKAGERITVASSLQATGTIGNDNKRIRLYSSTGNQITLDFTSGGRIENRTQEIAGPQRWNQTGGNRYTPAYYQVPAGGDGVYRVEFVSTHNTSVSGSVDANSNWSQSPSTSAVTIAAWDVSVINADNSSFIPGRVYTNVLNLSNGTGSVNSTGFYGVVYAHTKDGYTYRVDNNGNNGIYFTFFVNNNGFVDYDTQEPLYKSLNFSNPSSLAQRVHNPNNDDVGNHSTHKLFYTLPAEDFPVTAPIAVTNNGGSTWTTGSTWLKTTVQQPTISNIVLEGVDGTDNQFSQKGGWIEFEANLDGNYRLEIKSSDGSFATRMLTGSAKAAPDINRVYWDGKDGEGNDIPSGDVPLNVLVQLQGAEVHFPFFDMEYNRFGTIIELLNHSNLNSVVSDTVFWDDTDVSSTNNGSMPNPINNSHLTDRYQSGISHGDGNGISSKTNGHIWGVGGSGYSGQFGDEKSIDTWTFITGPLQDADSKGIVKIADLKITEVSTEGETYVSIGGEINYTVKVENGEPGDNGSDVTGAPFTFTLPEGFSGSAGTATFSGNSCGTESVPLSYDAVTRTYSSSLDLPNGCEVTYTFKATVTSSAIPGATGIAEAAILRPADVTDPNATNRSNARNPIAPPSEYPNPNPDNFYVPPFDANYECNNRDSNNSEPCNNILSAAVTVSSNTTVAVDDFVETDQNTSVSGNVLDNDYDPEGHTQTVSNPGTYTTKEGGSITINSDGSYTYIPSTNFSGLDQFEYSVCDDGLVQTCDNALLLIGVGVCTEGVDGEEFNWNQSGGTGPLTHTITQPPSNYGFALDIYELDNSFNMEINGTKIAVHEIEFQSNGTPGINVQFLDGDQYETNTEGDIWEMKGDADNPLVRVIISPTGSVSLWGSKTSGGPLFPLILTSNSQGPNRINIVPWNSEGVNTIVVTQNVVGATLMNGYGYGQNMTPCVNYWMGGTSGMENEWSVSENWTDNRVPLVGEDVEFATVDNYGTAAVEDLYLDDLNQNNSGGRIIGNLINNSDKNLIITTGNQLSIEGKVEEKVQQSDESYGSGTIVVKSTNIPTDASDPVNEPSGTLIVNPDENPNGVEAIVEFYNKAYDCADCGFYTRSWQYFGVPVEESGSTTFPQSFTSSEEVNEWSEPTNGNKWITPDMPLTAFTGYQITRNEESEPTFANAVHKFNGLLNLGDASVALTRTNNVNYSGMNLIGNSYTAAIPISADAITFPTGAESTVYLFNTGTRDQWRKLNGAAISQDGYRSGQYLAVPVNLGGTLNFPDRIPSMHSFMVLAESGTGGNLTIDYSKLVKNTTVALGDGSTQIVTRSANATSDNESTSASSIPSLVMDVIGEESADRVWIFAKEGTTHGFDNGWDGRKMSESEIAQLYVTGSDESVLQVATVPSMNNVDLGFEADADGKYTFEFMASEHLRNAQIFLYDKLDGSKHLVTNGSSYSFEAKKGEPSARFSLTQEGGFESINEEAFIDVLVTDSGNILVRNRSGNSCSVFISNDKGGLLQHVEVGAKSEVEIDGVSTGLYIVRLQNSVLKDVRRVRID